jgi:hypothetical protein
MIVAPEMKTPPEKYSGKSTEDQVDMRATVGQRIDNKGSKLEDEAGDGKIDSEGG